VRVAVTAMAASKEASSKGRRARSVCTRSRASMHVTVLQESRAPDRRAQGNL
jgi:hypothetical protein